MKKYDELFNVFITVPFVEHVVIDIHNIENINPDILSSANVWTVLTMQALVTKNSGAQVIKHNEFISDRSIYEKSGKELIELIKRHVHVDSSASLTSTIDALVNS